MRRKLLILFISGILSGCVTIENIDRTPFFYNKDLNVNIATYDKFKQLDIQNYWNRFNDKELTYFLNEVEKNNPNLSNALVNIKNYESLLINSQTKLRPNLFVNGSASEGKIAGSSNSYQQFGIQSSWEIDFLNKNKDVVNLNKLGLENAQNQWYDAKIILLAESAKNYFSYQYCLKNVEILKNNLKSSVEQEKMTELKLEQGFESKVNFMLTQNVTKQAKNQLIAQQNQCENDLKALYVLSGIEQETLKEIVTVNDFNFNNLFIPTTIAGKLLLKRPDIQIAQNNVFINKYDLEKVKKSKYPTIEINGSITTSSLNIGNFSEKGSWSIGPLNISFPILDQKQIDAQENIVKEKIKQTEIELQYKIRNALREIEVNLNTLETNNKRKELISDIMASAKEIYEINLEKYQNGLITLFELEDYRKSYFNAILSHNQIEVTLINNTIDLFKVMGGDFKNE